MTSLVLSLLIIFFFFLAFSNEKSTVSANKIPEVSKLSFDVGDNFDDYYKYIGNLYRNEVRKNQIGAETHQDNNHLQQVKSTSENHMGSDVDQKKIFHDISTNVVDHSSGALTIQVDNTWQQVNASGKNYMGSQARQKNNVYEK